MIEELLLDDKDGRITCSYFPPHIRVDGNFLKRKVVTKSDDPIAVYLVTNDGLFHSIASFTVAVANGSALYVLNEEGEARLWRLLPGTESND
jgi:hypothetical protein